jgi:uncharacterized protein (DUF736 family)
VNKPRKPNWRVSTPSQLDPDRWIDIGAAWDGTTDDGQKYISVQLDVMPTIGKLTLFPIPDLAVSREARSKKGSP